MVFSSLPVFHDPPNWTQQISHQPPTNSGNNPLLPPAADPSELSCPGRPASMSERARLAKIPQPEPSLKCPRCDSNNTKFCYFNNYSLSQPRHFCKTCRRYWTRGGALRNVPVGGGCRRNKRSKGSTSSKSSSSAASAGSAATGGSSSAVSNSGFLPPPPLPFMTSFHPFNEYSANVGLSFSGVHPIDTVDYQVGSSSGGLGIDQWRLQQVQQFPFLGSLDASSAAAAPVAGLFPFDGESGGSEGFHGSPMLLKASSSGLISQLASVKMEDSSLGLNLQRQYLGSHGNDHYWSGNGSGAGNGVGTGGGGGGWPGDLSGFNSTNGSIL